MSTIPSFRFHPYWVATFSVLLALVLMLSLDPVAKMTQTPFLLFFGAVVVSAWWGGLRAGLVTTVLSVAISNYFFVMPRYTFSVETSNLVRMLIFLLEGYFISALCGSLRMTNQRLDLSLIKLRASEDSLRAANQRITEILDSVTDGFFTLDAQWRLTYVNHQAMHTLRRSRDQLLAQPLWEVLPDLQGSQFEEFCHRAVATQTPMVFESFELIDPSRCFEVHLTPIHDGLAVYVQEVTERRRVEAVRLRLAEEREQLVQDLAAERAQFEAVLRQMPEGVMIAEVGTEHLILANEQAHRILQYPFELDLELEEYNERTTFQAFHPDGRRYEPHEYPLPRSLRQGEVVTHEEMEIRHHNGHSIVIDADSSPIYDSNGKIISAVVVFQDITERKRIDAALRDSEQRLQLIANNVPSFIWTAAPDGTMTWLSDAWYAYTHTQPEQANEWSHLVHPDDIDRCLLQWQRSLEHGADYTNEMRLQRHDGEYRWFLAKAVPMRDDTGQITAWFGTTTDIHEQKLAEEARRQTEERLRVALKSAPINTFSQDRELRYTWIQNPTFGYRADEVLGKHDRDFVCAEEAEQLTRIKQQVLDTGIGTRQEVKLTHAGREYYYHLTVEPLCDEQGAIAGITCAVIDISALKQIELALRQSEERFRMLAERVRVIPWEADPQTGQFTYVGPQALDILGYPLEQWYTHDFWTTHIYSADREWVSKFCHESSLTLDNYDFEYRMQTADGRIVWLYDVVNVVRQNGAPKTLRGIMIDITQRKRQEEAQHYLADVSGVLATSLDYQTTLNQLAQQIVPQLADWCTVHILDPDGAILPVATAHAKPDKVKWAQQIRERYPLDPDEPRGVAKVLRTGQSELYPAIPDALLVEAARDAEHLRLLREVGFHSVMIVPMKTHGKILGALSLIAAESGRCYDQIDLTLAEDLARRAALAVENTRLYQQAQHEQAKAEAANRVKDEFLAVLSHELRTPLNPILGWSKLLRTGSLDASKTTHALETIERNAKLQVQLIEDLLDVSRILRGKLMLHVAPVNLIATVEGAIETVRLAAEAKSIDLRFTVANGEAERSALTVPEGSVQRPTYQVLGDSARLQQVIWNLLTNAIKFTPIGGRVDVRVEHVRDAAFSTADRPETGGEARSLDVDYAQIQVIDTGKGISPEFLPFAFDYFRQADGATTRKFGGLGLGLAIARHLVELHGGTIYAESAGEGSGAIFTIRLPLRQSLGSEHDNRDGNAAAIAPSLSLPLADLRVLFVDDAADTRDLIAFAIEQAGATVTTVSSAREALQALDQATPDILLSDIGMPEMDGYMLIRQVRSRPEAQGGKIPAIALTAYASEGDHQHALAAGFQMHLSKPVEPDELVEAIRHLCGRSVTTP